MKLISVITLSVLVLAASASTWAVLIAGSNGYGNYRHQSDIFHAYQILKKNGVHEDHIITFAYDDIANNNANPYKGQVFNKPNGQDVYAGVKIDYSGKDVTPANFLAALTGDSTTTGGKKVLQSTENDNVFIYFSDHGAVGLVAVINSYLYADDLNKALNTMHEKKMYNKLVFYLEACESGSMFTKLDKNINIYATTAANGQESSWAQYCSPNDVVNGKHINSCLGDEYSVVWMEDSDAYDLTTRTLDQQFQQILATVKKSHPQQFGTLEWTNGTLSNFQGDAKTKISHPLLRPRLTKPKSLGALSSRMSTVSSLKAQYFSNPTNETLAAYQAELKAMAYFDKVFSNIKRAVSQTSKRANLLQVITPELPSDLACLKNAVNSFETHCAKFNDYGLQYVRTLANLCYTENYSNIDGLLQAVCQMN